MKVAQVGDERPKFSDYDNNGLDYNIVLLLSYYNILLLFFITRGIWINLRVL